MRLLQSMLIPASAALAVLAASPDALAHGEGTHLAGTVQSLSGDVLTVKAADGDLVPVTLDDHTKIEKGKGGGARADLVPGARIVVETSKMGTMLMATRVRIAEGKGPSPAPPQGR